MYKESFDRWCRRIFEKHFHSMNNIGCITAKSSSYRYGKEFISSVRIGLAMAGMKYPNGKPKILRYCENSKCYNPNHITFDEMERFFWNVNKSISCWEWEAAKDGQGYGEFVCKKYGREKAHRVSYMEFVGKIPSNMFVCHKCDNPSCVNPEHLFLGTNDDNIQDKVQKERQSRLYGKENGRNILDKKDVINMRKDYDTGNYSYRDLVNKYHISQTQVARIIRKESWSWVA